MLMSSMALSLRAIGERWEVSLGAGVMWYWTLEVHLTEKNLDPGGAPLRNTNMHWIVYTSHARHFKETASASIDKHLFAPKQCDGGHQPRHQHEFLRRRQNYRGGLFSHLDKALWIQIEQSSTSFKLLLKDTGSTKTSSQPITGLPHPGNYVKPDAYFGMTQQVTTCPSVVTRVGRHPNWLPLNATRLAKQCSVPFLSVSCLELYK